jgi:hypothetical protein
MAQVELLDDRFVIHNKGARRLLTIVGTITLRYEAVESVGVGLGEVPPWFTRRIGFNPGLGSRRAGVFWWRGKKWFLTSAIRRGESSFISSRARATAQSPSPRMTRRRSPPSCAPGPASDATPT